MRLNSLNIILLIFLLCSCNNAEYTKKNHAQNILIDSNLKPNLKIKSFIEPYRKELDSSMGKVLSFSNQTYTKSDGELNTALGNMMADAVFELTSPIFKKKYKVDIDAVLLNHGGIRSALPKGLITRESAFKIMPFENEIVVVKIKGVYIKEMQDYLINQKKAHPISGMELEIEKNGTLKKFLINGKNLDLNKHYFIATSDYLFNGGDRMDFFKKNKEYYEINYKIRDLLIDYFALKDTLNISSDNRFIYTN